MTGAISPVADGPNRYWHLGAGLEGRGVIVTGAASGIGRAVTISMAGARVAAIDRDEPGLRSTLSELPGDGHLRHGSRALDEIKGRRLADTTARRTPPLSGGVPPRVWAG